MIVCRCRLYRWNRLADDDVSLSYLQTRSRSDDGGTVFHHPSSLHIRQLVSPDDDNNTRSDDGRHAKIDSEAQEETLETARVGGWEREQQDRGGDDDAPSSELERMMDVRDASTGRQHLTYFVFF